MEAKNSQIQTLQPSLIPASPIIVLRQTLANFVPGNGAIALPGTNDGAMFKAYLNMTGAIVDPSSGWLSVTKAQFLKMQPLKICIGKDV